MQWMKNHGGKAKVVITLGMKALRNKNLICRDKNEICMRPDMLLSKYITNVKILNWCAPLFGMCVSALDFWLLAELE